MKDVYFTIASLALVAALFVFLDSRTKPRFIVAAAPAAARPVVLEPSSPTARRVGDDHWTIFLTARPDWFDTGIPVAAGFEVWLEPEPPATDCQFLVKIRDHIYSSELVVETGSPQTQRILVAFKWQDFPVEDLSWVDTVKLKLADSCRRPDLVLDIETSVEFAADDPLETSEEFEEHRQRILAGHRLAAELRRLFEPVPKK